LCLSFIQRFQYLTDFYVITRARTFPPLPSHENPANLEKSLIQSPLDSVYITMGREYELRNENTAFESLDYETPQNDLYLEREALIRHQRRHVWGYSGRTFAKFIVVALSGIITGLLAALIGSGTAKVRR